MITLKYMSIKLLEDNQDEWVYSIYTDYQEGQIAINKKDYTGRLTSFKKASQLVDIEQDTVEYEIYYRIAKLMETSPGIKEYYWLHTTKKMEPLGLSNTIKNFSNCGISKFCTISAQFL